MIRGGFTGEFAGKGDGGALDTFVNCNLGENKIGRREAGTFQRGTGPK